MADRIVVIERGRAVEQGTHAELLAAGGPYAAMAAQQGWSRGSDGAAQRRVEPPLFEVSRSE